MQIFINNKKRPLIPPLFHNNPFISDFKYSAEIFNDFFSNQCSLINGNSKLPTNLGHVTDRCLSSVTFSADDIGKIIQNLNSNKAHGHDNNSMLMLKIYGVTMNLLVPGVH